jgi:hypothetical protein
VVVDLYRSVEEDHRAVACEVLDRPVVRHDFAAQLGVILAQHALTSSGSAVSVKPVNPRRSTNTTVISVRRAFNESSASPDMMRSLILGRETA